MKKMMKLSAMFVAFALLAACFMGCDDGGGGGSSDNITISFNLNYTGATGAPGNVSIKKGEAIGTRLPAALTRTSDATFDYIFGGWFTAASGGTEVTAATTFQAGTTLYAKWTGVTKQVDTDWRITFMYDGATGGNTLPSKDVAKGTAWGELPSPTKTGNVFGGWFTAANGGGTQVTADTASSANITVYAKWTTAATISITVNTNAPAAYTGTALDAVSAISIVSGVAIGASLPAAPTAGGSAVVEMAFGGWYLNAEGTGTEVIGTTTFSAATTIYAKWTVLTASQFILVFDLNWATNPKLIQVVATTGEALGDKWPADPVRPGYNFEGWVQYDLGTGDVYTSASTGLASTQLINGLNTVFAKWTSQSGPVEEVPPAGKIVPGDGTEKVTFYNGFFVIYRFTIPEGKTYADYDGIDADYMFSPINLKVAGGPRTTRILGSYKNSDFDFVTPARKTGTAVWALDNIAFVPMASFGGVSDHNGPYIMGSIDTTNQGSTDLESWLDSKGLDSTGWAWNTVTYPTNVRAASGNGSAGPLGTDTGTLYFGIGFGGTGTAITSYIRNVKMIGGDGSTEDVQGIPLYFETADGLFPTFFGYAMGDGSNGAKEAYRGFVDGSTPVPYSAKVTFNLNYTGAPAGAVRYIQKGSAIGDLSDEPIDPNGKFFVEWNTKVDGTGDKLLATDIVTSDYTVYAVWKDPITITFNGDGGTPVAATKIIGQGGSLAAADLVIDKDNYLLDKWVLADGVTVVVAGVTTFDIDTTIKALWSPAVTVTIDLNTGATPTTKKILQNTALGADFPANPTRTGEYYTFQSWNTRVDGKGILALSTTKFSKDTTIYAQWKAAVLAADDVVIFKNYDEPVTAALASNWARDSKLIWAIPLPTGFNVTSYESITAIVKYFDADGEEVATATANANGVNQAQLKFATSGTTPATGDGANAGGAMYNLGANFGSGVIGNHTPIPSGFNETFTTPLSAATHVYIQRSNPTGDFVYETIKVYEITLHAFTNAITINIETLIDPVAGAITSQIWNLGSGNLKISAPTGLASYKWLINGAIKSTANELVVNASEYTGKVNTTFTVTLLAADADGTYSQTVIITVKK